MSHDKVWELVEALGQSIPFRREKVEALLRVTLEPDQEDDRRVTYRARSLEPGPAGVLLAGVDLRLRKGAPSFAGFLVVTLRDSGISRADVQRRFPGGRIEMPRPGPPPQGVSPDNHIAYLVPTKWGVLSFGFRVRAPDLLDTIAFDPRPAG